MKRPSIKQIFIFGTVGLVVAFALFGVESIPQYKTTTIQLGTVKKEIDFTTTWYPVGYAKIALGNAQDVRKIYVKEGQMVGSDTVLAQLNDDVEYNQYKTATSSFYAAIKARDNAKANPMTPKATLDSLTGQVNVTYYQQKNAKVALDKKKLKSPVAGRVVTIQMTDYTGATAASALTGAATTGNYIVVVNQKNPSVVATISEKDTAKVKLGMEVRLTSRVDDTVLTGKVSKVSSTPVTVGVEDPTYQITFTLGAFPKNISYGAKLEGTIVTAEKENTKNVQYDAITIDTSKTGSVLVLKDGKVSTVSVDLGIVGDDAVEVVGGLSDTDQVVIDQLADKKIITIRSWLKTLLGQKQ